MHAQAHAYPLGTRVTGGHELPCGCWERNPGSLEEQPVLPTAELSLQSPSNILSNYK